MMPPTPSSRRPTSAAELFERPGETTAGPGERHVEDAPARRAALKVHTLARDHYAERTSLARRNLPATTPNRAELVVPACVEDRAARQAAVQDLGREAGRLQPGPGQDSAVAALAGALNALRHASRAPAVEEDGYFAIVRRATATALGCNGAWLAPSRYGIAVLTPAAVVAQLPATCRARPELYLAPHLRRRRASETDEDYADRIVGYLTGAGLLRVVAGRIEMSDHLAELGLPGDERSAAFEGLAAGRLLDAQLLVDPAATAAGRRFVASAEHLATTDHATLDRLARMADLSTADLLAETLTLVYEEPARLGREVVAGLQAVLAPEPGSPEHLAAAGALEELARSIHGRIGTVIDELAELVAQSRGVGPDGLAAAKREVTGPLTSPADTDLPGLLALPANPERARALGYFVLQECLAVEDAVTELVPSEFWRAYVAELRAVGRGEVVVPWGS